MTTRNAEATGAGHSIGVRPGAVYGSNERLRMRLLTIMMLSALAVSGALQGSAIPSQPVPAKHFVSTSEYDTRSIEGWTVHVNHHLLSDRKALGDPALQLLKVKLYDVLRVVPPRAAVKLQSVPIWLGINDGHAPCSEYHPSRDWLSANGYNPDKAKCVEIGNAANFLDWSKDQPFMVLHELAHAYQDQVLGFDNPDVRAAYQHALHSGLYQSVLRSNGRLEKAYALTDEHEYFAEGSEAYFGTNDFYPFVRAELVRYDPMLAALLKTVWNR